MQLFKGLCHRLSGMTLPIKNIFVLAVSLVMANARAVQPPPCAAQAAEHYGLQTLEVLAVSCVESRMNPNAINKTHQERTGSVDIGAMQINSRNVPALAKYGIGQQEIKNECVNYYVGAWLLAQNKRKYGDSWNAYGAYNAACTQLKGNDCVRARSTYAWKVYRAMNNLRERGKC